MPDMLFASDTLIHFFPLLPIISFPHFPSLSSLDFTLQTIPKLQATPAHNPKCVPTPLSSYVSAPSVYLLSFFFFFFSVWDSLHSLVRRYLFLESLRKKTKRGNLYVCELLVSPPVLSGA